jgi:hypothetical protein
MLRYGVAFCAVCLGGLTAAADLAVSLPLLPPQQRGVPGKPSEEEDRLIFDACITFYGIVYATGRLLYRWRGARPEAEELRRWSRSHLAILNVFGGCWLILSGWPALHQAVLRPSLVVGALLVVLATLDGWRGLRDLRGEPPGQL